MTTIVDTPRTIADVQLDDGTRLTAAMPHLGTFTLAFAAPEAPTRSDTVDSQSARAGIAPIHRNGRHGWENAWAAKRARTAARLEDLEDLLAAGESPEHAAARVGWTPTAASRAAYRHGDLTTARILNRLAKAQHRQAVTR